MSDLLKPHVKEALVYNLRRNALLKEGSKHLGVDRAAGNGNDRWPYFSDASCVESDPGGLFVIEYVSSTP